MASVNKQIIVGRLGKDPEVKQGQGQAQEGRSNAYCFVGVATDDVHGKNPDGTWKTETTWHNVNVYGQQAEYLGKFGKKGDWVYVEGRTQHKKDEKGGFFVNVIASQVIVMGSRDTSATSTGAPQQQAQADDGRGAARAAARQEATPIAGTPAPEPVGVGAGSDSDLPF